MNVMPKYATTLFIGLNALHSPSHIENITFFKVCSGRDSKTFWVILPQKYMSILWHASSGGGVYS